MIYDRGVIHTFFVFIENSLTEKKLDTHSFKIFSIFDNAHILLFLWVENKSDMSKCFEECSVFSIRRVFQLNIEI